MFSYQSLVLTIYCCLQKWGEECLVVRRAKMNFHFTSYNILLILYHYFLSTIFSYSFTRTTMFKLFFQTRRLRRDMESRNSTRTYSCSNFVKFPSSEGRGPEKLFVPKPLQYREIILCYLVRKWTQYSEDFAFAFISTIVSKYIEHKQAKQNQQDKTLEILGKITAQLQLNILRLK